MPAPYGGRVRWEALFDDLERRLSALEAEDVRAQVAETARAERGDVRLVDRLQGAVGTAVALDLPTGPVRGVLREAADEWVLLAAGPREVLVPVGALGAVSGSALLGAVPAGAGAVTRRLGLAHALRAVSRDRTLVRVVSRAGTAEGRIDAVGADHLVLGLVHPDSGRPNGEIRLLPFSALELVSTR